MRAVIQRVQSSRVEVANAIVGEIGVGLTVLLGVAHDDTETDVDYLAEKIVGLRIFPDDEGRMNRSLRDISGQMLIISQFTLYADCSKGKRPSFIAAAPAEQARRLYESFCEAVRGHGIEVATGIFQADMLVSIANHGPVTIIIDSRKETRK